MKLVASASPPLRYEDHYLSSLVGAEVEISLQSDDSYNSTNWNPPTTFEDISILEDPTPVWPGGPPPWWQNEIPSHPLSLLLANQFTPLSAIQHTRKHIETS